MWKISHLNVARKELQPERSSPRKCTDATFTPRAFAWSDKIRALKTDWKPFADPKRNSFLCCQRYLFFIQLFLPSRKSRFMGPCLCFLSPCSGNLERLSKSAKCVLNILPKLFGLPLRDQIGKTLVSSMIGFSGFGPDCFVLPARLIVESAAVDQAPRFTMYAIPSMQVAPLNLKETSDKTYYSHRLVLQQPSPVWDSSPCALLQLCTAVPT